MDRLSKETLRRLVEENGAPCVTISFRTQHIPVQEKPDRIKLDNLLRECEERIAGMGKRPSEARTFLQPLRDLLDPMNDDFWQHQGQGLAMFRSAGFFNYFRLPYPVREILFVSDHFQLKPLLPILSGDGQFYILALGFRETALYRGSQYGLTRVEAGSMPGSLAGPLQANRTTEILSVRGLIPTGLVARPPVFSGGQVQGDVVRNRLLQYFQGIRSGIDEFLAGEKAPLVLAGAGYLPSLYRDVNTYPHLADDSVAVDPSSLTEEELLKRAWSIVGPQFEQARRSATDRYKPLAGTPGASHNIGEIVPAAFYGKVDVLFVSSISECWGRFDAASGEVLTEKSPGRGAVDLLDFAAAHTSLKGGTTYVLPPAKIPDAGPVAAIYRY